MLRPAPRSASIGLVRVANHAGAAPNRMPVTSASVNANARTAGAGVVSIGRNVDPGERERQQQARRADRDDEAGDAAGDREEDALDQRLRHDLPARRADREPDRRLRPPRHGAREQQVGDVGARDEQHQPAHAEKNLQAA